MNLETNINFARSNGDGYFIGDVFEFIDMFPSE